MTDLRGWKTCPRCASDLALGEIEEAERLHCTSCGLVIYDNPAPTACGVIVESGRLMLTKRGIDPALNMWDLPGGYIEVGEHPDECLKRELLEETGLEVEIDDMLGIFLDTYGDGGTDTLNICYRAHVVGGDAAPASDVIEIRWFDLTDLPWENLAFRNTREALKALTSADDRGASPFTDTEPQTSER